MKYFWPWLIVGLFLMFPAIHGQSLSITRLTYPSNVIAGSLQPIVVTVSIPFSDAKPGGWLLAGIAEQDANATVVPGTAMSTPDGCFNQPIGLAFCRVQIQSATGFENFQFKFGGIFANTQHDPGSWDLTLMTSLLNANNTALKKSTMPFTIHLSSQALTLNVPRNVSVTIDGRVYPGGIVPVGLGQHRLSVPLFASMNETTRVRFDRWSDGISEQNRTIQVTSSATLTAIYVVQYRLIIQNSAPASRVSGAGWYDKDTTATFSVGDAKLPTVGVLDLFGAKGNFQGWYENGKLLTNSIWGTIKMSGPHTITAQWSIDYSIPSIIFVLALGLGSIAYLTIKHPTQKRARAT